MGDHHIGREMGLKAEAALAGRKPGEDALDILDRICMPYRGRDAEFEAESPTVPGNVHEAIDTYLDPHPDAALGMLMLEAFAPEGTASLDRYEGMGSDDMAEDEAGFDLWNAEVQEPFRARYGFC